LRDSYWLVAVCSSEGRASAILVRGARCFAGRASPIAHAKSRTSDGARHRNNNGNLSKAVQRYGDADREAVPIGLQAKKRREARRLPRRGWDGPGDPGYQRRQRCR
jgi:hypothetical protein